MHALKFSLIFIFPQRKDRVHKVNKGCIKLACDQHFLATCSIYHFKIMYFTRKIAVSNGKLIHMLMYGISPNAGQYGQTIKRKITQNPLFFHRCLFVVTGHLLLTRADLFFIVLSTENSPWDLLQY